MKTKLTIPMPVIKRTIATVLSLGMLMNGAAFCDDNEVKPENNSGNKFSGFVKNHPIATSAITIGGGIPILAGMAIGAIKLSDIIGTLCVRTPIDHVPDSRIQAYLDMQIGDFLAFGQDGNGNNLFIIGDEIKREADPRVLALVMQSVNMVFKKDQFFADTLKEKLKKEGNRKLEITWGQDDMYRGLFGSLTTVPRRNGPYTLEINKMYGKSMYQMKTFSKDHCAPQESIVWGIGYFFEQCWGECIIPKEKQLTIERFFELAQAKNPALGKNNMQFSKQVFERYTGCSLFAELFTDYVLGTYP
ncbi:MAG: hypothetical protein IKE05_04465, partial [Clostridia bacterium]|nr:hypothetical protein [Clostridia bacterium]